ncbi:MAG: ATP-binding protein, partial [Selenomonadaceae bacterium]|nr:ATP-binding protein [Selenomonadaceae bacterium]
ENDAFPTLADFLRALQEIVDTKGFSDRLRNDYIGSLVSRFSNLLKGSKGALFNCKRSTNFERLIDMNVVIEMENLKSAEDKALLMGFILTRLTAVIKRRHSLDKNFRHITLVEEAHRLLSRVEFGDSGSKRTAVATFTDLLAEVRKYGESLIVVDQIPNKLAPEVLKNTNTKIIHRLFARDDKESVGDTMLMDDKQKAFLSALDTGQAIVFSEGMERPVHVKIQSVTDTGESFVSNEVVRDRFIKFFGRNYRESEIVQKFSSSAQVLLKNIATEFTANRTLSAETLTLGENFKREATRHIEMLKKEFGEDATEFFAERLATEFSLRNSLDKIFRERLTKFLYSLLTDRKILSDYEQFRLLDTVKKIF